MHDRPSMTKTGWGWSALFLLLISAPASAEDAEEESEDTQEGPAEAEGPSLDEAWSRLDAGDGDGALELASAARPDAATCDLLVLRGLAHEQRGDLETARATLSTFFDLGCDEPDRQARATAAHTRIARRLGLSGGALEAAPTPADPSPAPDDDRDDDDRDDDHLFEDTDEDLEYPQEDDWAERDLRGEPGKLSLVDARAVVIDRWAQDYRIRFELLIRGSQPDTNVTLVFNPPGASWLEASMKREKEGHYSVTLRLDRFGDTHWRMRVTPDEPFAAAILSETRIISVD